VILKLIHVWRATLALVLKCYGGLPVTIGTFSESELFMWIVCWPFFFFFETKGVYSTLRNKPHSKPRTFGSSEAREQPRKLIKQPHLGTGRFAGPSLGRQLILVPSVFFPFFALFTWIFSRKKQRVDCSIVQ
jgi:hypothetical protein